MPSLREEVTRTLRRLTWRTGPRQDPDRTVLRTGRQMDSYRILRPLGAGGMGQVYLALDARLGRHVALKFLPPELTSDAEMFQRLEQEARTASALNHPNIVTIYEIGEFGGERYIVSEFVDGVTLRTALERKAVDFSSALDIAMQAASALVAAHTAGVTHRDIKPANIMVRHDGYIKVIDFGIAKAARKRKSGSHLTSGAGAIVGTVDYMSPEQARGDEVDTRTDLWSLGVLLYEMLIGERPFRGRTESHVIVNILDNPPAQIPASRSIPLSVMAILDRALAKERAERYQTASEMLSDLHEAAQRAGVLAAPRRVSIVEAAPPVNRKRRAVIASVAAAVVAGSAVWWWGFDGKEIVMGPDWFQVESVRPMTSNGRVTMATISPDGKYLAYVVGDSGEMETVYLQQTDSRSEEVKIPARKITYRGLTFSPDSLRLYEVEEDNSEYYGKLYAVPVVGSRPNTPIIEDVDGPVSFSPAGDRFAFVRYHKNAWGAIETANADGSDRRELVRIQGLLRRAAWSPRGDAIANFVSNEQSNSKDARITLHLINLTGRERSVSLPGWEVAGKPCWTNRAETLITSSATAAEGNNHAKIREISARTGRVEDITRDLAGYSSVSLTRDGRAMAAVRLEFEASVWVSGIHNFDFSRISPAHIEARPTLAWTDPSHLILNNEPNGFPNLEVIEVTGLSRTSLTAEPHFEQDAVPVPGKDAVVFASNRSGPKNIWKYDKRTNSFTQLTFGTYDESPGVTPDGNWVVFVSWKPGRPELYKVPISGGNISRIGTLLAYAPVISPDGKFIACRAEDPLTQKWSVGIIAITGEGPFRSVPQAETPFRWAPDGSALDTVITDGKGVSNIWSAPIDGQKPAQLTKFDDQSILAFDWSPDGSRLACMRVSRSSDVVLFRRQV